MYTVPGRAAVQKRVTRCTAESRFGTLVQGLALVDRVDLVKKPTQEHGMVRGTWRPEDGAHLAQPHADIAHEPVQFGPIPRDIRGRALDVVQERHRFEQLFVREIDRAQSSSHTPVIASDVPAGEPARRGAACYRGAR